MTRTAVYGITSALVASTMLGGFVCYADDLQTLREAAGSYVVAMKAVLNLPGTADCSEISAKATEYATAKVAYYNVAREAMPSLIGMVKGENTDQRYGEDLIELFRGFGDEEDAEATVLLISKLRGCENSDKSAQLRKAIEEAQQVADEFLKAFARLEGT
jgi:hypothetical protein